MKSDQAMGQDSHQEEDFNGDDDRVMKIPYNILIGHESGRQAAKIMIDSEVQPQYDQKERT
jgi:hypothetical protein